jgi:hypothetical protein
MDDTRSYGLRPPVRRPRAWRSLLPALAVLAALAVVGAALWWLLQSRRLQDNPGPPAQVSAPADGSASAVAAGPPVPEPRAASAPVAAEALGPAVERLVGGRAAATLLQGDRLARRIVVTVDNLAREQAPASQWPVVPAAGRFSVVKRPDGTAVIHPENAARYAPLVGLLEGVDSAAAVALYVRVLPSLQRAYEDLGFPKARFHDRVVQVIDHLLTTPEAPSPLPVTLTDVKGDVPSVRPWVRWEYADPAFERASAGRKILWRLGPQHTARLKAKLRELRSELQRAAQQG